MRNSIELKESKNGFSQRDLHSKAILNSDSDSLLRYKIQKNRMNNLSMSSIEVQNMQKEIANLKSQLDEIKSLLLKTLASN